MHEELMMNRENVQVFDDSDSPLWRFIVKMTSQNRQYCRYRLHILRELFALHYG